MQKFLLAMLLLPGTGLCSAAEPAGGYPLWDNRETVASYAQRNKLDPTKSFELGNGVKLELVLIPPGRFIMGTPEPEKPGVTLASILLLLFAGITGVVILIAMLSERKSEGKRIAFSLRFLMLFAASASFIVGGIARWRLLAEQLNPYEQAKAEFDRAPGDEKPGHAVLISKPLYMGKYTVTQEQHDAVMGMNTSFFKGPRNPVDGVSWDDAQAFCNKLNAKMPAGMKLRLPTEAQWEYACRAGTKTRFYSGDHDSNLDGAAWHQKNSVYSTHPVGEKMPNAFGLYDMHGNIWQWCGDWLGFNYYAESPERDPPGPAGGTSRVLRGGAWDLGPWLCRAAIRNGEPPERRSYHNGFRVALPVPPARTP